MVSLKSLLFNNNIDEAFSSRNTFIYVCIFNVKKLLKVIIVILTKYNLTLRCPTGGG